LIGKAVIKFTIGANPLKKFTYFFKLFNRIRGDYAAFETVFYTSCIWCLWLHLCFPLHNKAKLINIDTCLHLWVAEGRYDWCFAYMVIYYL